MTDNKVMLNTLRNCHQKEFEEGIKLEQSQWTSGMNKFSSDNSLMDKRRNKRAKARARMQRNYIAAKAQLRSAVLKKDRDLKQGKSKNSIQNNEAFIQVSTAYLTNEEGINFLLHSIFKLTRLMFRFHGPARRGTRKNHCEFTHPSNNYLQLSPDPLLCC
eukprot:g8041.t1